MVPRNFLFFLRQKKHTLLKFNRFSFSEFGKFDNELVDSEFSVFSSSNGTFSRISLPSSSTSLFREDESIFLEQESCTIVSAILELSADVDGCSVDGGSVDKVLGSDIAGEVFFISMDSVSWNFF